MPNFLHLKAVPNRFYLTRMQVGINRAIKSLLQVAWNGDKKKQRKRSKWPNFETFKGSESVCPSNIGSLNNEVKSILSKPGLQKTPNNPPILYYTTWSCSRARDRKSKKERRNYDAKVKGKNSIVDLTKDSEALKWKISVPEKAATLILN